MCNGPDVLHLKASTMKCEAVMIFCTFFFTRSGYEAFDANIDQPVSHQRVSGPIKQTEDSHDRETHTVRANCNAT